MPAAASALSQQEIDRLIDAVRNVKDDLLPVVVKKVKNHQVHEAAPWLVQNMNRSRINVGKKLKACTVILDGLDVVAGAADVLQVVKWAKKNLSQLWGIDAYPALEHCVRLALRFGYLDDAAEILKKCVVPSDPKYAAGLNLKAVLLAGEVPCAAMVTNLCKQIKAEKKMYNPGFSFGYLLLFSDPIALAISAGLSLATTIASNAINHASFNSAARSSASLMVLPESVDQTTFAALPAPAQMMTGLHCYSTALANIASREPKLVRGALRVFDNSLEQAVICLALAMVGDADGEAQMNRLARDSDWVVRIFAYEGLIVLDDMRGTNPGTRQFDGLQDKDIRVFGAVTSAMAASRSAAYSASLLDLTSHPDKEHREAMLPVLARMAILGDPLGKTFLTGMASRDPVQEIRQAAQRLVDAIP